MSGVTPVRVGFLADRLRPGGEFDPNILPTLELVAEDYLARGLLDRPVEFVVRAVEGLPGGSFRVVRDAYLELVEEDCLVVFGPYVSENGVPLREHVDRSQVPIISMGGTETMLSEWVFALNNGSMEEEPHVMAAVAAYDGCRTVGIAYETSLLGLEYLDSARRACEQAGLRIVAEVAIPQVETEKKATMEALSEHRPDAVMHIGFGLGLLGMNAALEQLGWTPRRYTTTAFLLSNINDEWRHQLAGWVGLDQYDERNHTGQEFLDRFEARYGRRPEYFFPLYCYDVARLMLTAVATARPLTGGGVRDALERIKMMPAACGAPGTRLRFGRYMHQGWVGSEYLVARRIPPDGSRSVMHGTIAGLVNPG